MARAFKAIGLWIMTLVGYEAPRGADPVPAGSSIDDAEKLRRYERFYVARMLGIATDVLDRCPYKIVGGCRVGATPVWRVVWQRNPPRGVEIQYHRNTVWTDIPALFSNGDENA